MCMAGAACAEGRPRTKPEGTDRMGRWRLAHPCRHLFQRHWSQAEHPASHALRLRVRRRYGNGSTAWHRETERFAAHRWTLRILRLCNDNLHDELLQWLQIRN